jgi:hypothetical protein
MRLEEGRRIVGTLIPGTAMDPLIRTLKAGAESSDTYIQEVTIDDWAGKNREMELDWSVVVYLHIWKVRKLEWDIFSRYTKYLSGPGS